MGNCVVDIFSLSLFRFYTPGTEFFLPLTGMAGAWSLLQATTKDETPIIAIPWTKFHINSTLTLILYFDIVFPFEKL